MSSPSFDRLQFLMKISPDLLIQFAKRHGIVLNTKNKDGGEKVADEFMNIINDSPQEAQSNFWGDAEEVYDLGHENSCDYLVDRAVAANLPIDKEVYTELKNSKERALYFHMHFPELFTETREVWSIEKLQGGRSEQTVRKTLEEVLPNMTDFREELKSIYAKEYKGEHLKVKHYVKGNDVTFIAYIEDVLTNELGFKRGDLNPRTARKPVFAIFFIYRLQEGILEVKARGGKKKIEQLQKAFIKRMLNQKDPEIKNAVRYNFAKVQDIESLTFPITTQDLVDCVTLKGLRIVNHATNKRLTIDIGNTRGSDTAPMRAILNEMSIDLMDYEVTQFKLEIFFKDLGKGKKRKITVTITHPNICDLKEREIDSKVRKLLKQWRLDLF